MSRAVVVAQMAERLLLRLPEIGGLKPIKSSMERKEPCHNLIRGTSNIILRLKSVLEQELRAYLGVTTTLMALQQS